MASKAHQGIPRIAACQEVVYLDSQQEDAAQEPIQAVLRGAFLALHAGGSVAER